MSMNRRDLMSVSAILAGLAAMGGTHVAKAQEAAPAARSQAEIDHEKAMMDIPGLNWLGTEQIAMLLYPGFTALDLIGPHYFFGGLSGAKVHLISSEDTLDPIISDMGISFNPSMKISDCPTTVDLIFVPGGTMGTMRMMEMPKVLSLLAAVAANGNFVTSTCTGSLVLAAAGVLKGKKATSHWAAREALADFGAIPVDKRVVQDGKIVTGAGVSAGIDMAISVVRLLRGDPYAQGLMLIAEYAPEPPMVGGTLATTEPRLRAMMEEMVAPIPLAAKAIAAKSKPA